jgi:hypothetical protein
MLTTLYLLDTMSKNLYKLYGPIVVPLFLDMYSQVDESTRAKMIEMLAIPGKPALPTEESPSAWCCNSLSNRRLSVGSFGNQLASLLTTLVGHTCGS